MTTVYLLSAHERQRLTWLRLKIAAAAHLDSHHEPVDFAYAKRLGFARFLVQSGRLRETQP